MYSSAKYTRRMAPQHNATMGHQQQQQQQQQHRRRSRPMQTQRTPSRCSSCRTRRKPRSTFTVALTLLLAVCCCWCRHAASAFSSSRGGSSASPGLTLRVRMPDGAVKRVQATAGETVDDICLLYTSPSPRDKRQSRMPSSA